MSLTISLDLQRKDFSLSVHTTLSAVGFCAIYGHSGAGKTTLLRWLAGLEKDTPGKLIFNQQTWQDEHIFRPSQQRNIAYVFQDARLFPHLTAQGNLEYAYRRRFNNNGPTMAQVCEWLELEALLRHKTTQLSGGEKQRVAIARALLSSPELILMDEPLASLDTRSKNKILQHLENLQQRLTTPIIYVSHDLAEVSRLANEILLLEKGRITAQGPLLELSTRLDLSLSHQENAASIIEARVQRQDEQYQLTELSIDDQMPLYLTKIHSAVGTTVRVRIPARDVSIALEPTQTSSILNILPATIDAIEHSDDARTLIRLNLAKQKLLVRLTQKSVDRLALITGQTVYAQIKTVALLNEYSRR